MPFGKISRKHLNRSLRPEQRFNARVQRVIDKNVEKKFVAKQQFTYTIGDGPTINGTDLALTDIVVGNDQNQRNGNQVRITGMHYTFNLNPPGAPIGIPQCNCRIIVYKPKKAKDTMPLTHTYDQLIDMDRFTALYDKTFSIGGGTQPSQSPVFRKSFTRGGKTAGMLQQYEDSTGTGQTKGTVRVYMVSDESAASEAPLVTPVGRTYYNDA